jgi:hypothetical protein
MQIPDIKFTDPCFEEQIKPELGGLVGKFNDIANDTAHNRYGKTSVTNPSDIELTPMTTDHGVAVIMRMWHQTSSERPAVLQSHDTTLKMRFHDEDAFLHTEDGLAYPLTTREAFVLQNLAAHALLHAMGPDQEF